MGGSNSRIFGNHDWQFIHRAGNTSNFDIVRDKKTGITAEKHTIPNNPTMSEDDQMKAYHYRNLTNKPVVKVYDAEYVKGKGVGACGAPQDITVYSQYIPYRLSDLKNLNHGQGLYVLSEALAGFNELNHRFGPFQVTDDHIGFNEIGEAKVWHSPNFATNHLNQDNIILMSTANPFRFDQKMQKTLQSQMVEDIYMAVSRHTNFYPQFVASAGNFKDLNFQQAHHLVSNQIAKNNTYVPDFLTFKGNQSTQNFPQPGSNISSNQPAQPNQQIYQTQINPGNQPNLQTGLIHQNNQSNLQFYQPHVNTGLSNPQIYQTQIHQNNQLNPQVPQGQIGQIPAINASTVVQPNLNQNYSQGQGTYQSHVVGYQNFPQGRNQVQSFVVDYKKDNTY